MSPLNGVRQRLTPSHGAGCEPWPWPAELVATEWALAAGTELVALVLLLSEPTFDCLELVKGVDECDTSGWLPFGCGARKKLLVVSLVPRLYIKEKKVTHVWI